MKREIFENVSELILSNKLKVAEKSIKNEIKTALKWIKKYILIDRNPRVQKAKEVQIKVTFIAIFIEKKIAHSEKVTFWNSNSFLPLPLRKKKGGGVKLLKNTNF